MERREDSKREKKIFLKREAGASTWGESQIKKKGQKNFYFPSF